MRSYLLIAPSVIWMALFLVLPLAMIVYVSFWTQSTFKIEPKLTLDSWQTFFGSDTYLNSLWTTLRIWLIVLVSTFVLGYPTALFVGLFVRNKTLQTALLVLCVIPFLDVVPDTRDRVAADAGKRGRYQHPIDEVRDHSSADRGTAVH